MCKLAGNAESAVLVTFLVMNLEKWLTETAFFNIKKKAF